VPRYRFTIRDTDRFDDEDGMILPDDGTAREYAIKIMDATNWCATAEKAVPSLRVLWTDPRFSHHRA
jgi:hypothetical protein